MAKKWKRLHSLLNLAGIDVTEDQASDPLAVILELSKRFKSPKISFDQYGAILVDGICLNAAKFCSRLCYSLESKNCISEKEFLRSCESISTSMAHKESRDLARKTERHSGMSYISAVALGGAPAEQFYSSKKWKEIRYRALEIYGNVCQACGRGPRNGVPIHVDHIKPRSLHPELAYNLDNLQILCEDCNLGKSNKGSTDWRNHADKHEPEVSWR